jgi:serine/threonine protein phosphatase 1
MAACTYYAIGDVHGQFDLLSKLHQRIQHDIGERRACVIHLGDLVDRGPNSAGAIEAVMALEQVAPSHVQVMTLLGNHEQMMLDAIDGPGTRAEKWWLFNGGRETLGSYGIEANRPPRDWPSLIPATHIAWLRALPIRHIDEDRRLVFVHAGIDPDAYPACSIETNLWTRAPRFTDSRNWPARPELDGLVVVHGHQAQRVPVPDVEPRRVNVDTAAGLGGPLSAAVLVPGKEVTFIQAYPTGGARGRRGSGSF